jgi:hypothetical protein
LRGDEQVWAVLEGAGGGGGGGDVAALSTLTPSLNTSEPLLLERAAVTGVAHHGMLRGKILCATAPPPRPPAHSSPPSSSSPLPAHPPTQLPRA